MEFWNDGLLVLKGYDPSLIFSFEGFSSDHFPNIQNPLFYYSSIPICTKYRIILPGRIGELF
jgi:hypothetical protein